MTSVATFILTLAVYLSSNLLWYRAGTHFWQWCWEIAERRRLETGWQMGMEL